MKNNIAQALSRIKQKIPSQGPLDFFVHHNTLHHYQDLNFHEAVKKAAQDYSCQAFMPEEYYRDQYKKRVIKREYLYQAIADFIKKNQITVSQDILYSLLIKYPISPREIHDKRSLEIQKKYFRSRSYIYGGLKKKGKSINTNYYTTPLVLNFLQCYFDLGNALWTMPDRHMGIWHCFNLMHSSTVFFDQSHRKELAKNLKGLKNKECLEVIEFVIDKMSIKTDQIESFLFETVIRYKGWSGYIKSLHDHPEWQLNSDIESNFEAFVTILLISNYSVFTAFKDIKNISPEVTNIPHHNLNFLDHFFEVFDRYSDQQNELLKTLPLLTDLNRQEILHNSYENSFYFFIMSSYKQTPRDVLSHVEYQVVCCIDDRMESFRRYLERDESCETFGFAGHFGLNIEFKRAFEKRYRKMCPVNAKTQFKIDESFGKSNTENLSFLNSLGCLQAYLLKSSRQLINGILGSLINFIYDISFTSLQILDPKFTKYNNYYTEKSRDSQPTVLNYKKNKDLQSGLSLDDRVFVAKNFMKVIGLNRKIAKFVFICGHGSSSLNNPHETAYNCGACGGGKGMGNARLMASILNEKEVRYRLRDDDIFIPPTTQFIGCFHNTCNNELKFFDINKLTESNDFIDITTRMEQALVLDAQERCRRFNSALFGQAPEYYLDHVLARAIDIRQPRPEYNHATNAICVVGPRFLTRNLFLDRRAFLVSYEPKNDKDASILKSVVNTAVPVCAGINLEYYFSYIDNEFYGCGSKLPHNLTGLLGVMNGYMSDLRPGLSWQMVEIHQPIRLLVLIYRDLDSMKLLLDEESEFSQLAHNQWVQLLVHDSNTDQVYTYNDNQFEIYNSDYVSPRYILPDKNIMNSKENIEFGVIVQ